MITELLGDYTYTIPSGYEAEVKDGKVIVRKKEEPLTEFGDGVLKVIADYVHIPKDKDGAVNIHDLHEFVENASKELLELAFKSPEFELALQKSWDEGNLIGYGAGQKSVEKELDAAKDRAFKDGVSVGKQENYELFKKAYMEGREDEFKSIPKWKKATKNMLSLEQFLVLSDKNGRATVSSRIPANAEYISINDICKLPKE